MEGEIIMNEVVLNKYEENEEKIKQIKNKIDLFEEQCSKLPKDIETLVKYEEQKLMCELAKEIPTRFLCAGGGCKRKLRFFIINMFDFLAGCNVNNYEYDKSWNSIDKDYIKENCITIDKQLVNQIEAVKSLIFTNSALGSYGSGMVSDDGHNIGNILNILENFLNGFENKMKTFKADNNKYKQLIKIIVDLEMELEDLESEQNELINELSEE
jgi:hypothetical protein